VDARLLAAREPPDRHLELLGPEEESTCPARDVYGPAAVDDLIALGRERAGERDRGIELRPVLVQERRREPVGVPHAARVRREVAREEPNERGFPAAVRAEEAKPRAGTQHEARVVDDAPIAEPLADVLGDDEELRAPLARVEVDRGRPAVEPIRRARELVAQPARLADARLRLRRAGLGPRRIYHLAHAVRERRAALPAWSASFC
jgi:hypothetical protein